MNVKGFLGASALFFSALFSNGLGAVDIRINQKLDDDTPRVSYTISVDDCQQLTKVEYLAADGTQVLSSADQLPSAASNNGCEFVVTDVSATRFSPSVNLSFNDGTVIAHSESFTSDNNNPSIELDGVAIENSGEKQFLVAEFNAEDDVDIRYIGYKVVGIRASQLRSVGGVVEKASEMAFAKSESTEFVYPTLEGQTSFKASIPVSQLLSSDAVARDAVVLVDAYVVDASGNQSSISKISFTGDNISEAVLGLSVNPSNIVFSNLLEKVAVIPTVDYEFRGPTPLPGAGTGVSFTSTNTEYVRVTSSGIVFPIQETGDEQVFIEVAYPGVDTISIPVEVNFSKTLVSLEMEGYSTDVAFQLPRLNQHIPLPEVLGVFDDGSKTQIGNLHSITYRIPEIAQSILSLDSEAALSSSAVINDSTPINLQVYLTNTPAISMQLPITANDAIPEIELEVPSKAVPGQVIKLIAHPSDDVGVASVKFFNDVTSLGSIKSAPFELQLPITEIMVGTTLKFTAIAQDTAGQTNLSEEVIVKVANDETPVFPDYTFELPVDNQRFVEDSPIVYSVSYNLGDVSEPEQLEDKSGITRVEYFWDGVKEGQSLFKGFEVREVLQSNGETVEYLYEVWKYSGKTKSSSLDETSAAISAIVHFAGAQENAPTKLIRILKNQPPTSKVDSPTAGSNATVGQTLRVSATISDDTLAAGTDVSLFVNGALVQTINHKNLEEIGNGSFFYGSATVHFDLPIIEEHLGETLELYTRVTDFHKVVSQSEPVRIPVKADQAPSIGITNPIEGSSWVGGLPIEIRADASDDLSVEKVDFYVNDRLIGSDYRSPYSVVYETQSNNVQEQALLIYAIATDSKNQSSKSQTVNVTLGNDEERPVLNIVSPEVSNVSGENNISEVVELSETIVKIAGYDNVGATSAEITGVRKEGPRYVLTGDPLDKVSGDDFRLQSVPGAINAYSALLLVQIPEFLDLPDVAYDSYPISVTVYDEAGNYSKEDRIIGVINDDIPVVKSVSFLQSNYFNKDVVKLNVTAEDDKGIEEITVEYFLNGAATPIHTETRTSANGLVVGKIQNVQFEIDLANFDILNQEQSLTASVRVSDSQAQQSDAVDQTTSIKLDDQDPIGNITSPTLGSILYQQRTYVFKVAAKDNSGLSALLVTDIKQDTLLDLKPEGKQYTHSFDYTIPEDATSIEFNITVVDVNNRQATTIWEFEVESEKPPVVDIRAPANGTKLIEGESFTLVASASDDSKLNSVSMFIRNTVSGEIDSKYFSGTEAQAANANAEYLTHSFRVPSKPANGAIEIGVTAVDDSGLEATQLLEIEILDDQEPPQIVMLTPE
ncbi:MAG: Ig-like domain-containing protein, partial [Kangiellaceae bacterium]|nr:Ig-like domain-containing protein [Kangiellaceae bacterium]